MGPGQRVDALSPLRQGRSSKAAPAPVPEVAPSSGWSRFATGISGKLKAGAREARILRHRF
ncbi:hypothetical protein [Mycobacterium parmense]|uniref:Uncharacterized protein n=1 Tax=Mycobacterium parmense TaxID=185642 RepID=A0A7I7YTY9_9MYCO|nr:hypothetical protein [Mycobacterium parmense]MCV7352001.1 hypothetical protein [Mycobacterium parmense]ORW56611.1 hypothetical protein AWC20_01855 [Mycobacterium parmense]BBZ44524.1 hypothetical protein MPRM_18050 [Mycobacterium parmense]